MKMSYLFGLNREESFVAEILYSVFPDWGRFWQVDMLTDPGTIPWSLVGMTAVYAGLYVAGILALTLGTLRVIEIR